MLRLDADRRIVAANRAVEELTGRARAELVGVSCADALAPRRADGTAVLVDSWPAGSQLRGVRGLAEQEVAITVAGGRQVRTRVTGRYERDPDGNVCGLVLVFRRPLRRSDVPSGIEVVSTVSHELRSPLTSVKGYTSLLLNRWERLRDDQKRMMLEQVHHDADRVTRLVTELLDISRLETGRLVLRRQLVQLPDLLATILEKVALEYPDLEYVTAFPPDFPRVFVDPDKIEQVLTNLVENAAKYGSPVGLRVEGRVDDENGDVSVSVADRGEGIPAADLSRIFEKFFRRDHGKPTGTGLGLWISQGLVEAHGGRLTAASTVGEGTTFTFTLPFERDLTAGN